MDRGSVARMSAIPSPITGRCLCGNVTYRADAEPVVQAVCHCADCQRQTGNPFSVIVAVPRDALHVEGDSLSSYATIGEDHGAETERSFCSNCGSPLFSIAAVMPEMAFVKAGSLDDSSWLTPAVEAWTRSAQPWAPRFEGTMQLERGPGS
jgi:hypothetical protein